MKLKELINGFGIGLFIGVMAAILFSATYTDSSKVSSAYDAVNYDFRTINAANDTWYAIYENMDRDYNLDFQFEQTGDSSTTTIYVDGSMFPIRDNLWFRFDTITVVASDTTGIAETHWEHDNVDWRNLRFDVNATDTVTIKIGGKFVSNQ